ncbi:DUF4249 domain-containing protein [Daejeonella sp.]|uniref:DUF4249 domain-containing protein n=1 Tax=Daejeonella sp. TaxID=2805397 RepID=UPI00272508FA|nr:DUF4249 domain-containing protein [Daejeonella sp.]MDO8994631.1 DUF4249 domain-containing protein [Daejeonella sp.]MDP2413917.1 DUF4249 domain-containing protein [Daejeonella sp.]
MKKYTQNLRLIFCLINSIVLLSSCEKVIDLELKNADPLIVIEGTVSNQSENHFVRISKTIPFHQSASFKGVKGAQVTLKSSAGLSVSFTEVTEGIYRSPRLRGTPGLTYTLDVLVEGKTYSAKSTMPSPVIPDSIGFKTLSFFGNSNIYPTVYYNDPPKIQNQYRYILRVNGKLQGDLVFEDRFNDGNTVSDVIIYDGDDDIKSGDIVDIEMQSIDRNVFKYFFALSQIGGNGGPPVAPANPESNFSNRALGIFNACTKSTKSVVLK